MKNQQQAQKEEQRRIKNLVLNYDLQQNEDQVGKADPLPSSQDFLSLFVIDSVQDNRDRPATFHHNRIDRPKDKGQRSRKLQLSDMDW